MKDRVSFEAFSDVWNVIGKSYDLNPQIIRPTDTFHELSKADSWLLGKGEDDLSEWLDRKGIERPPSLHTVLDLATWVQAAGRPGAAVPRT